MKEHVEVFFPGSEIILRRRMVGGEYTPNDLLEEAIGTLKLVPTLNNPRAAKQWADTLFKIAIDAEDMISVQ